MITQKDIKINSMIVHLPPLHHPLLIKVPGLLQQVTPLTHMIYHLMKQVKTPLSKILETGTPRLNFWEPFI